MLLTFGPSGLMNSGVPAGEAYQKALQLASREARSDGVSYFFTWISVWRNAYSRYLSRCIFSSVVEKGFRSTVK